ncbi:MAG: hypothetical protein SOT81_02825 [Treponema sp.]|nr:hypothetical protein [Treponema sp.]
MDFYNFLDGGKRFFGQKPPEKVKFRAEKGEFKAFSAPKKRKKRLSAEARVFYGVL